METKGYKEAFEAVANGKVYFTIATLPVLSYYKRKYHMNNLQITGYTKMKYKLCMAVRKDDEILVNILNKMLDTIPKKTKNIIYDKWAKKEILKEIDYSLIYKISFVVFALIILFIVRNIYLKKHNKELFEQINEKNKIEEKLRELNKTLDMRIKWAIKNIQKQNDKLQESIENFQNILDTTMEMIILFDKDGKIVEINQSGVNIMGFKNKSEIISTNIESYILKKDLKIFKKKIKKEFIKPYETTMLKNKKEIMPVLMSGRDIIKDSKKIKMLSVLDLTELKQKDQQLLQQSRLAQMGEMISMIAHQWRQPLSAISATSGVINLKAKLNKLDRDLAIELSDKIIYYSKHLSSTIDDFRNFFKSNKELRKTSYNEIINSVLNIIETSVVNKNIAISKDLRLDKEFYGYPNELMQVVLNFVKNAEDALVDNEIKEPIIKIRTYKQDEFCVLEVADNAGGIPEDIIDKIFDPYFSTKTQKMVRV